MARFAHVVSAIDTHTGGEPTRIVLSGLPPIPGATMAEKKRYLRERLDYLRTLLMLEPRGHGDMFGAILTPPTSASAHYGALFMDATGYLDMCGHGTIGLTTMLIEMGIVPATEPETTIAFDTPAGLVEGRARVEGGKVIEVSVTNVASFLYARDVELDLPALGPVAVDIAFGGNFFALVPAPALGVAIQPAHAVRLAQLGMLVKRAINSKLKVQHPIEKHIQNVELVEIYERPEPGQLRARNVVIFGDGQIDRSACGTGTSAAMAALYGRGELGLGQEFINEGLLGTRFRGRLVRERWVGDYPAVEPIITGQAYITGIQQFVVDPDDPLAYGFALGR